VKRFRDDQGAAWTAALWCGSYGEVLLMFSCQGRPEVFSAALEVESLASGEAILLDLDDSELRQRLAAAELWQGQSNP
jgi:hypothetical protein